MAQATRGLFRAIEAAHVTIPRANLEIIVQSGLPGSGRCALRPFQELEVTQDSLDDARGVDEAHDLQRTRTTAAQQGIATLTAFFHLPRMRVAMI
jgi:hypothetical protein